LKIDRRLIFISINIYVFACFNFFLLNIFLLLKDRTHIELYISRILIIIDEKNVIGQSETLREIGVSVFCPEAFSFDDQNYLFKLSRILELLIIKPELLIISTK